jgi:hypothetical protein
VHKYQASGKVKNNKQQNRNIEHKFREKSVEIRNYGAIPFSLVETLWC